MDTTARNEFGYTKLEDDGTQQGGARTQRRRRSVLLERQMKEVIDEENRRRAATYVAHDKWDEATTSVWFPCERKKQIWDSLILVVLLYTIWVEPFRIGTNTPSTGWWNDLDMTFSFLFIADIIITFNTAYLETSLEGDNWVIDRRMIAAHYLQGGRFFIELFSAYPAELVNRIANSFPALESKPVFRLLRLLRLLRLARVVRELNAIYAEILLKLESRLQANLGVFQLVGPLAVLIYLMHVLACAFVGVSNIALSAGEEHAWLLDYDDGVAMVSLRQRYLIALYWASGTATGLGTGVIPMNEFEWGFVSAAHVIGVIVMGSVIGWIARSIESSQSPIEKEIERKTDIVKDITRWRAMPPVLADHVIRFYTHYSRKHAAAVLDDEKELLESLAVAPSLRRDVLKHLLGKSVNLIPAFTREHAAYATDEFQLAVDPLLHPVVYEPSDVIFERGSLRSSRMKPHHQLFFLIDGTAKCSTRIAGRERMLYTVREEGEIFGEHVVLGHQGIAADVSCVALSRCDVFSLARDDLLQLLAKFPDAAEGFATFVLEALLRHKCSRYFSLRISLNESLTLGKGVDGAALRIQLATFRRQKTHLRYAHPIDVAPILFSSVPPEAAATYNIAMPDETLTAQTSTTPVAQDPAAGKRSYIGSGSAFTPAVAKAASTGGSGSPSFAMKLRQQSPSAKHLMADIATAARIGGAPKAADASALEAKLEAHVVDVNTRLSALQSAIDANSLALHMLVKEAQARRGKDPPPSLPPPDLPSPSSAAAYDV